MPVIVLPAFNPGSLTGDGNNTYLVGGPDAVLIDAGTGDERHLDLLKRALHRNSWRLARVLVTHAHVDHISGAEALRSLWPEVAFAKMPWPERDARFAVPFVPLLDDEPVPAGNIVLRALHTPGHAPDHLSFWEPSTRTLFCGDLVRAGGTVMIPASHGGDLAAYLASLRRVLDLGPKQILPAHGPALDHPEEVVRDYLAHRQQREEQVLAALHDGYRTREAIVDRVYMGLAAELRGAAGENVLAHLLKLESEGRAMRQEDDDWRIL